MKKTLRIILIKILYKWVKFLSYVISKTLIYACGGGFCSKPTSSLSALGPKDLHGSFGPKADKLFVGLEQILPHKKALLRTVPMQRYCSLWVVVFETCSDRLYHHNTCVVVVHSYLQLRLIRHEWGVSFFNVGASLKNYSRRLKEQSRASPLALEWTNCLRAWNKILPHNACKRLS